MFCHLHTQRDQLLLRANRNRTRRVEISFPSLTFNLMDLFLRRLLFHSSPFPCRVPVGAQNAYPFPFWGWERLEPVYLCVSQTCLTSAFQLSDCPSESFGILSHSADYDFPLFSSALPRVGVQKNLSRINSLSRLT